jgi:hypothetical protein
MKEETDQPQGRREFMATGVRWVAVGGMATLATAQAYKTRRLAGDPNCIRLNTCNDCIELSSGCQLTKAQAFRQKTEDKPDPNG